MHHRELNIWDLEVFLLHVSFIRSVLIYHCTLPTSVLVPPHSIHHSGTAGQCPGPAPQHSQQWHGWPASGSHPTQCHGWPAFTTHSIHHSGTAGQCPAQHSPQWYGWPVSCTAFTTVARLASVLHSIHHSGTAGQCPAQHSPQWHGWPVSCTAFTTVARLASVLVPPHSIHHSGTGQCPDPAPQHSPQCRGW